MKQTAFDPLRSLRTLLETLYCEGLTEDALRLSQSFDTAQLEAWREPLRKKA